MQIKSVVSDVHMLALLQSSKKIHKLKVSESKKKKKKKKKIEIVKLN